MGRLKVGTTSCPSWPSDNLKDGLTGKSQVNQRYNVIKDNVLEQADTTSHKYVSYRQFKRQNEYGRGPRFAQTGAENTKLGIRMKVWAEIGFSATRWQHRHELVSQSSDTSVAIGL